MKKLVVPQDEVITQAFLPMNVYEQLTDKFKFLTYRGWLEAKMRQAGFDLTKEITTYKEVNTLCDVYIQVEEGDQTDEPVARYTTASTSSEISTEEGLQTLSWDRIHEAIKKIGGETR